MKSRASEIKRIVEINVLISRVATHILQCNPRSFPGLSKMLFKSFFGEPVSSLVLIMRFIINS